MPRGPFGEIRGCGGCLFILFLLCHWGVKRPFGTTRSLHEQADIPAFVFFLLPVLTLDVLLLPVALVLAVRRALIHSEADPH